MHPAALDFCRRAFAVITREPAPAGGWAVLDLGAHSHNGSALDAWPAAVPIRRWWGVDLQWGPGVHAVADAAEYIDPEGPPDLVISTEVFEHAIRWPEMVANAARQLRPGGWLLVTCATRDRAPHGADGGALRPGEWYRGVAPGTLAAVIRGVGLELVALVEAGEDVYALARRQ